MPGASEKKWGSSQNTRDIQLLSYSEMGKGASYLDFVRRHKVSWVARPGQRSRPQRYEFLVLKYGLGAGVCTKNVDTTNTHTRALRDGAV